MEDVRNLPPTENNLHKECEINGELNELLLREELLWKQKSRIKCVAEGDRCTKFYFLSTVVRRRRNFIDFVKDNDGRWLDNRAGIGSVLCRKFQNLFASGGSSLS